MDFSQTFHHLPRLRAFLVHDQKLESGTANVGIIETAKLEARLIAIKMKKLRLVGTRGVEFDVLRTGSEGIELAVADQAGDECEEWVKKWPADEYSYVLD